MFQFQSVSQTRLALTKIRNECRERGYVFSVGKYRRALKFFQKFLVHVKGDLAGQAFVLEPWQRKIIKRVFGWVNAEGYRVVREVYIEVPRKNGKSFFAAGFALYLLHADNEMGAEVISAAADTEQAAIVYDTAKNIVLANPKLKKITRAYRRAMSVMETASRYQVISAEAYTKHGKNLSGIVVDELHAQPDRELVDVLHTSTSARKQPLTVYLTTAGYDRNSICWEKHEYAAKLLAGIITDYSFYPVIFAATPEDDWTLESTWFKANPNLGISKSISYMRAECRKAKNNPAYENTFKRLELNIWTEQDIRWMPMAKWDTCGNVPLVLDSFAGETCWGGLDLGSTGDMTAFSLVFARIAESSLPNFYIFPFFFVPEEKAQQKELYKGFKAENLLHTTPGAVTDYAYVENLIADLAERFNIAEVCYDRWNSSQTSINLEQRGIKMTPFGQGFASMSPPTKELMSCILTQRIQHGGHKILRWNASNVTVEQDAAGNVKPSKKKSTDKIDGIVATIMGLDKAMRNIGSRSVYAERELMIL